MPYINMVISTVIKRGIVASLAWYGASAAVSSVVLGSAGALLKEWNIPAAGVALLSERMLDAMWWRYMGDYKDDYTKQLVTKFGPIKTNKEK